MIPFHCSLLFPFCSLSMARYFTSQL
uniref:Uncharacterized protein n=1 Tax=Arundo donax TaxID=35708 RepID=A0A0A9TSU9_ARUDO